MVMTRPSNTACAAPLHRMCATHTSLCLVTSTKPFAQLMSPRQNVLIRRSSFSVGSDVCQLCSNTFFRLTTLRRRSNASLNFIRSIASSAWDAMDGGRTRVRSCSMNDIDPWL